VIDVVPDTDEGHEIRIMRCFVQEIQEYVEKSKSQFLQSLLPGRLSGYNYREQGLSYEISPKIPRKRVGIDKGINTLKYITITST